MNNQSALSSSKYSILFLNYAQPIDAGLTASAMRPEMVNPILFVFLSTALVVLHKQQGVRLLGLRVLCARRYERVGEGIPQDEGPGEVACHGFVDPLKEVPPGTAGELGRGIPELKTVIVLQGLLDPERGPPGQACSKRISDALMT